MTTVSKENKKIAKIVSSAFGGYTNVVRYWDEENSLFVDILSAEDRPYKGIFSYGTLGLSDDPMFQENKEFPVRIELIGACKKSFSSSFANVLSTTVFFIIRNKWFCCPGTILKNMVDMYNISKTMKHLLLTTPFLWEDNLKTVDLVSKKVTWLLAVPISETEMVYTQRNGSDKLEGLFVKEQIDIFDLCRPAVV